ncbi:MAG: polyphosphate polymerase domain-containing protein [Spirochaetales bacterium]|nr:polyphosphate polymerase domain-containing protein [Spirochaetales bacterium]
MGAGHSSFERKEMKYVLTAEQYDRLVGPIASRLLPDDHPRYTIRNLYLDTPDYRLIRRSLEKPVYKEKMRLRCYGASGEPKRVFVELKKKYKGIVYKRRIKVSSGEALRVIRGESQGKGQVEREIEYFRKFYPDLKPVLFLSYDREAYRGRDEEELRLTFDRNIRWREEDLDLGSSCYGNTLLDKGQVLMEIKCAGALPLWLTKALGDQRIYRTSFSKYGRAYGDKLNAFRARAAGY